MRFLTTFYKIEMNQRIIDLRKRASVFLNDKNKKGFFLILKEAVLFWIVKKEFPYFYFGKFLYRKGIHNYKDYLSSKEVDTITLSKNFHQYQYTSLLRNKLAFANYIEQNNLPVPRLLSYNFGGKFYYNAMIHHMDTIEGLNKFFVLMFGDLGISSVFVKSVKDMGGIGCFLIKKESLQEDLQKYGAYILNNDCIHQEVIVQHPKINRIYKNSLNTIRFDTYIDKESEIHILSAFMRFGRGGSVIDNGSLGGIYVSVDIESGTLKGKSHQLMKYGGGQLDAHPDSKILFDGFVIPYFQESKELVIKAVSYIPNRIIGWDIGISEIGSVLIEGNDNNSLITPDIAYGGYLKHPLFKEIMEEA